MDREDDAQSEEETEGHGRAEDEAGEGGGLFHELM